MNFIPVKSFKNLGLAIVVTIIFGPLGLFYSSAIGGFIILLFHILFAVIAYAGMFGEYDGKIFYTGLSLLFLNHIMSIIWAIMSTNKYNNELEEYGINLLLLTKKSEDSRLMNWLKQDPTRTINEYNEKFK